MYTKSTKYPNLGLFDDNYPHLPPPDDINNIITHLEADKNYMRVKIKKEADILDDEDEGTGMMCFLIIFWL